MSLPEALEQAAAALPEQADLIRPANGDPTQLLATLTDDGSQQVLAWLLTHEPEAGEDLLLAWCEDDRGVERVQSIDVGQLPKPGKKLLRKALHRMRTSGLEVADAPAAIPVVARLSEIADEFAESYMTPVDSRGTCLLFLVEANPTGGARLFQVQLDERRGIVEFEVYNVGRSKTRKFLRKLTDAAHAGSGGAVKVDQTVARGEIRRIAKIHPTDRPFPRAFSEWRRKLEAGAGDESLAELTRRALGDHSGQDSQKVDERIADRVRASEIGPWPPDASRLTEVSTQLGTAIDAVVSKKGKARSDALDESLAPATAALFEGDHAIQVAARFETSAYVALKAEREEDARDYLAIAANFRAGELAGNLTARAMTEVLTASVLKRVEEPAAEDEGETTPSAES
ncbi:MAG: hypothetical protein IH973_00915 [Myxococcales bacterium]|nr:hypothetical protein [Myxococcales bacterium]